jgi:hypothetical protein
MGTEAPATEAPNRRDGRFPAAFAAHRREFAHFC